MSSAPAPPYAEWDRVADLYAKNITRFTSLHGTDLIGSILPQIRSAATVLEIACGSGAFGHAYLNFFPLGIPGQTLIFTDISPKMVAITEESMNSRVPAGFQTKMQFRVADACDMERVTDGSVDAVVSLFGVFLVNPRERALGEVRRVLRDGGVLATTAWTDTPWDAKLAENGFGHPFQGTMGKVVRAFVEMGSGPTPWKDWDTPEGVRQLLSVASFKGIRVFRNVHSAPFASVEDIWGLAQSAPVIVDRDPVKEEEVKKELWDEFVKGDLEGPIFLVTASNIAVASK